LQQIFEAEIEEHLGYKKHSIEGNNTGNSRNGYNKKTIQTKFGKTETEVPRDRNGEFEPRIIGKYEKTSNQLEEQIIAMYAKGMSTGISKTTCGTFMALMFRQQRITG
jgi:Transposase and inactivated derivatives